MEGKLIYQGYVSKDYSHETAFYDFSACGEGTGYCDYYGYWYNFGGGWWNRKSITMDLPVGQLPGLSFTIYGDSSSSYTRFIVPGIGFACISDKDGIDSSPREDRYFLIYATINGNTITGIANSKSQSSLTLASPFPNPFNPSTTISFTLPASGFATLSIYNISGQKVRDLISEPLSSGTHSATWDGTDGNNLPVASGIYFSRLESGGQIATGKMLLVR